MTAVGIYIYMLRCADGSYYVGSATGHDLSMRNRIRIYLVASPGRPRVVWIFRSNYGRNCRRTSDQGLEPG